MFKINRESIMNVERCKTKPIVKYECRARFKTKPRVKYECREVLNQTESLI